MQPQKILIRVIECQSEIVELDYLAERMVKAVTEALQIAVSREGLSQLEKRPVKPILNGIHNSNHSNL
jgi:hypothetical protein